MFELYTANDDDALRMRFDDELAITVVFKQLYA